MSEEQQDDDFPLAIIAPPSRWLPNLVWLIPITALVLGAWLALHTFLEHGPSITISFLNADGIEAGKTHVKYKSVDIGMVRRMSLSPDRSKALVTVELAKSADAFLAADTRFWIVRPRIAAGEISGLNTLLSGPYIGVDIGTSQTESHEFAGMEVPPIVTGDLPGHQYELHASDLGSVDIGTPVFFRRVQVGEVVAYTLDPSGKGVTLTIFVHAPFDQFVTEHARFWEASGVDVSIDGAGIRIDTQSLISVLVGGIAFESVPGETNDSIAKPGQTFKLLPNRAQAMKRPDGASITYLLYFPESVRGLPIGAPVDFRGVVIGDVADIGLDYDAKHMNYRFPVAIHIYPGRLHSHFRRRLGASREGIDMHALLNHLVAKGLRAQLRSDSLITGQLYVAMDFFPAAKDYYIDWDKVPQALPTVPGGLDDLQQTLLDIAHKIDHMPLNGIGEQAQQALATLNKALVDVDGLVKHGDQNVLPELKSTLIEAKRALSQAQRVLASNSPLQTDTRQAMIELSRAAQSLRTLADLLGRDPQALVRGRGDPQPEGAGAQ